MLCVGACRVQGIDRVWAGPSRGSRWVIVYYLVGAWDRSDGN